MTDDEDTTGAMKSGGEILVEALVTQGVTHAFGVPGESYLAVLDALYDARSDIELITCRQEGGAANMAEAHGKLTGRPGICFVTRGPGATNASIGVHTAFQDSTPMILFIGQVARDQIDREAFQEIDFRRMFGEMAKWVAEIHDPARIPEYISRAFHTATNGRPGPVVLALPEDMLRERAIAAQAKPYHPALAAPSAGDLADLKAGLEKAERPLIVLGGGGWSKSATDKIAKFVVSNGLPVGASFRCKDLFDNGDKHYVGDVGIGINPKLAERVKRADLVVALGPRLGEMTTSGYTLFKVPDPEQTLIHIHGGAEELGRVYNADLKINASMGAFADAIADLTLEPDANWGDWRRAAREDFEDYIRPIPSAGDVNLSRIFGSLWNYLPKDAILCNGAGNYAAWLHRFHIHQAFRTQLAPTSGAMGYGVPAAIGAKASDPARTVIAVAGDGCFLMTGQELATAVHHKLGVIFIVVNNGIYGTIRMHQERNYPKRKIMTDLTNPDFKAYAEAFGAEAARVVTTESFEPAFRTALAHTAAGQGPYLIELITDPEAISPGNKLSELGQ
jgi:acetolactate synthase I/II/III large subunit